MYKILRLNSMSQQEFTQVLGSIFEHTPVIAQKTWYHRPFKDVNDLHQKMVTVVNNMSNDEQLTLIKAHPDLGSKAKMAEASIKEQSGVGLDKLNPEEYDRFQSLNKAYQDKFGFPFIIAVKNHTRTSILAAFEERSYNTMIVEHRIALAEISQIAYFRLVDIIHD